MGLVDYDGSSDDAGSDMPSEISGLKNTAPAKRIDVAPLVSTEDPLEMKLVLAGDGKKGMITNADYATLSRPVQGPQNPFNARTLEKKNVVTGFAETQAFDDAHFRRQHQDFASLGYVKDPSLENALTGFVYVGDTDRALAMHGADAHDFKQSRQVKRDRKRKREGRGDVSVIDGDGAFRGPWAKYEIEAPKDADLEYTLEEEDAAPEALVPAHKPEIELADIRIESNFGAETSEFFGKSLRDYQGRTYMHVSRDIGIDLEKEPGQEECFVPKRNIHSWTVHKKSVTALRFFPKSGHLLLSASSDSKVMLFDCHHERSLLREYSGHFKAVRDVCFNADGTRFLSAGYDAQMKLWDTETGQCISKFTTGKLPYVVKINPDKDKQHEFLAGMSDKKIVQFDMKSGEIVQEYTHHLGPVNTVTFIDENRRFVTTSDDKSLRAWEYGIPVPIKYIAEPEMHSMPAVAVHPSQKYFACQSLDNSVVVYSAIDKIKQQRRKIFRGHGCAGHAIEIAFSPDGKYLSSGDAGGYACFWDWKTCKLLSKFAAHKGPLTQIAWHPQETSKVATGGNDGVIHYWD
ncbi:WD40-repeat-containing domain protein [Protomyces lactucae-debilis]|uniref:Pre-mRNA-processing factor 17 n=1 Tax=Protomyces lactucae-debilis TaxID=2754530 RepID=A0A1Y2FV16_PROLT|nr:WD40-repeat-containing domain protein [Protomyces lactucae-debilis]ORY87851.1 WD40-repeat-containing domain protein [Protomyces lactucae-debilis]